MLQSARQVRKKKIKYKKNEKIELKGTGSVIAHWQRLAHAPEFKARYIRKDPVQFFSFNKQSRLTEQHLLPITPATMEEPKDSSNDPSTPHPTEGSPEEQPGPSSSGGRKGRRRGPKDRSKEKASPEVLKALKRMRESFDNHRRAFPFLDASSCWDPDEFSRENQRLLALGYKGSQLVDKLCTWAAGGRLAILLTDRETYLLVRTFDKEERLITHHLHPFSRGCGFQCTMMNAKMPEEIAKEREKLSRQRTYAERASDESSDDKEHRSDREGKPKNPI